jgi:preprotein translocase subunit YajC
VKGAKVVTNGGIIGTVVEANDQDLVLRVEEGRIRVTRNAVGGVLSEGKASSTAELKNAAVTTNA